MAVDRRVLLTRTPLGQGERFTVDATEGNFMPNEIFRMLRKPNDPENPGVTIDIFLGVCSPVELQTLPINGPFSIGEHFRVAHLDLTFTTFTLATAAWEAIIVGTEELKDELDAFDTAGTPQQVWVGVPP